MNDVMLETAAEIAEEIRAGRMTARSATTTALNRIAARDDVIGAFQKVRHDAALAEADAIDAHPHRERLPLAGVPIAIKDNVPVAGEPMRMGSLATEDSPQREDHEVVRRLRSAGAVVVGLTRTPELCVYGATDSAFGITRNPWNLNRTPGGSSGGSAAAVAAGMVPVAHGNDGMGSIRIPSACCGLVGLKPGFGVVPAHLGNGSWFDMAENGPMTTTVADNALLLSVMANDESYADAPYREPAGLRIAVSTQSPMSGFAAQRHWVEAAETTAQTLRCAGHAVQSADPPYGQSLAASSVTRWACGTARDTEWVAHPSQLQLRTRRHASLGRALRFVRLPRPIGRLRWQRRVKPFFDDFDVLITPALARDPIRAIDWSERGWLSNVVANARFAPFAAPWNLAGYPAMTVPAGTGPKGLPTAVQLVAAPGGEATLLAVAAQLERLRPWIRTAPTH